MSGGSFDYLCFKNKLYQLVQPYPMENLERMVDFLRRSGYEDVARDTQRLVEYIKSAEIRVEVLAEQLSDVFKAAEWYDSGDWELEDLDRVIQEYRSE